MLDVQIKGSMLIIVLKLEKMEGKFKIQYIQFKLE